MANRNDYKQLGKIADGRIRKNWPVMPPFGPLKTCRSRSKGFENLYEPDYRDLDKEDPRMVQVSCYQNPILQCVLHVPEFFNYLSRPERCFDERCHDPKDKDGLSRCMYCALRELALHYWSSTRPTAATRAAAAAAAAATRGRKRAKTGAFEQEKIRAVRQALRLHPSRHPRDPNNETYVLLDPGRQHDTHEYFTAVMQMLHHINEPHRIDTIIR